MGVPPPFHTAAYQLAAFWDAHGAEARKVLLIMRISEEAPYPRIVKALKDVLSRWGLTALRADDHWYTDHGPQNVLVYMLGCQYAIAVIEDCHRKGFNPNIAYECGFMDALGKPVLLLKDRFLSEMPFDLVSRYREEFSPFEVETTIGQAVERWIRGLIPLKAAGTKMVVLLSTGGTCRCRMAQAALRRKLSERGLEGKVHLASAAQSTPSGDRGDKAVGVVLEKHYGDRWPADEPSRQYTPLLGEVADLLVATGDIDPALKMPPEKTATLLGLAGRGGAISDPYPDGEEEETIARHLKCLLEIEKAVEDGCCELLRRLGLPG